MFTLLRWCIFGDIPQQRKIRNLFVLRYYKENTIINRKKFIKFLYKYGASKYVIDSTLEMLGAEKVTIPFSIYITYCIEYRDIKIIYDSDINNYEIIQ